MIRRYSYLKLGWDIIIILIASLDTITMPLFHSFDQLKSIKESGVYMFAKHSVAFIYILDIIVAFRTTFYSKSTGEEIFSFKRIAKRYLGTGGFFIDFIATLPILANFVTN